MNKNKNVFSVLMGYAGKYKILSYMSLVLSVISGVVALLPFVYIWKIVKELVEVAPNFSDAQNIAQNGWLALACALAYILLYLFALMCSHVGAFRISRNMKEKLVTHIAKMPIGEIVNVGSGKLRQITLESTTVSENYLAHQMPDMAQTFITPVAMIVFMFIFDWRLGLISLIPVIIGFLTMFSMVGPSLKEDMKNYQDAIATMSNEAVEYVRGIPVVKVFNQSVFSFKRFAASINNYAKFCLNYTYHSRKTMSLFITAVNSVACFLSAFTLIMSGVGLTDLPFIVNLMFYIIFTPIISTTFIKVMFMSENNFLVKDANDRINSILEIEPLKEADNPKDPEGYKLEFNNVKFHYKNASYNAVDGVSFEVPEKGVVALVGPSGGGKSTIANLIARFYDVNEGEIKIGGVNIKDMRLEKLREVLSYVFQDNKIFKGTILDNVRLANENATEEEVMDALQKAQCMDIVNKFKDGIHTVLGTQGTYLSGGETQRICIARCFLRKAKILLLDEATAFADPENERLVQLAFANLAKDKSIIMIAHRLSTVKNADNIIVIKDGKIAEQGTHDELMNNKKLYSKMWNDYQRSIAWKVGR